MPAEAVALSTDSVLGGRLTLRQMVSGHRVGHDALLLAAFAPADRRTAVDLGTGVGSAGLAFLARVPEARATLVEIDPSLAVLAAENAALNSLDGRAQVVTADVATLGRPAGPDVPGKGAADLVLANPPFNADTRHRTSPDEARARAHMADADLLAEWVRAADRCLGAKGVLCLIHRPEALADILAALAKGFGAIEILPVHPRADRPAVRLLVRAVKGRRTPPALLPGLVLAGADGSPTPEAEAVLRDGGALR
ncbi:methyltransferase [Xanthobacter sp. 126]|uniref:tRNA1(Val) (adenine(37)-N6)-methyltransferase n=1 Tax=Xanthobacter sp. 126 TaxID=1131814 RepID=UPI00045E8AF5|nr:methyltransferase [Xanthobacter sp. 126]